MDLRIIRIVPKALLILLVWLVQAEAIYPNLRLFTAQKSSQGSKSELDIAREELKKAFERYTKLVTTGGAGDVEEALKAYEKALARVEELEARLAKTPAAPPPTPPPGRQVEHFKKMVNAEYRIWSEYDYYREPKPDVGKDVCYIHGKLAWHKEDDRMRIEATYIEGYLDGRYREFDKDGNLINEGFFREGDYHGTWIWYYPDGLPRYILHFVQGRREGIFESYDETGEKTKEGAFTNDVYIGPLKEWTDVAGRKVLSRVWDFKPDSYTRTDYDANGNPTRTRSYQGTMSETIPDIAILAIYHNPNIGIGIPDNCYARGFNKRDEKLKAGKLDL